jgi:AAA+ superfamily predicted ATPase
VPWKRGVLLLGPPGNGKTHAVKALINVLGKPCLYVKSFATRQTTDGWSIRQVFGRARESAPCVLVLEDLDSLITDKNRSFFLNELDGFAANRGILTLASTNHPDRLDPAIVNRPSRFDRKFHFDLPAVAERRAYIAMWNRTLKPELRLTEAGLDRAAESTAGFSFAYLKELFVSAVMGWMHSAKPGAMDAVIEEHVAALRREMVSSTARVAGFAAPTA